MAFANIAALKTYINANIITNGAGSITGAMANTTLLGVLQFLFEENTIVIILTSNTTTITDTRLVGATNLKVTSSVRLIDNNLVATPVSDGFTFDSTGGIITFASTRASGEVFVIDFNNQN